MRGIQADKDGPKKWMSEAVNEVKNGAAAYAMAKK